MGIIIDAYDLLKSVLIFDLNVPNSEKLLFELICGAQMKKYVIKLFALACACAPTAFAQDLVYEPINPSFGGNPFNSAHLLAIANAQNDFEQPVEEASSQSELDSFVRSLQSRLLSSLSTQVANAIFGEDAQDEGRVVFGDQTIEFVRTLDGIQLTITEADGSQTVITIPVFTTDSGGTTDDDSGVNSTPTLTADSSDFGLGSLSVQQDVNSTLSSEPLLATSGPQPIQ